MTAVMMTGEISSQGWDVTWLFVGGFIGMVGAVLMMIWSEVQGEGTDGTDGSEANGAAGRGDGEATTVTVERTEAWVYWTDDEVSVPKTVDVTPRQVPNQLPSSPPRLGPGDD